MDSLLWRKWQWAQQVFLGEAKRAKFKQGRSVHRRVLASLFSQSGHSTTSVLKNRRTFREEWSVITCSQKVIEIVRVWHPRSTVIPHGDNVSSDTATGTNELLTTWTAIRPADPTKDHASSSRSHNEKLNRFMLSLVDCNTLNCRAACLRIREVGLFQ